MTSGNSRPRVAIITGAGRGIGRATAMAFARNGIAVAIASRRPADLMAVEGQIEEQGGKALAVPTDKTAEEVRRYDVEVMAVCPGSVATGMLSKGLPGAKPDMTPEAVASLLLYLSTEAPAAMSGSAVDLFG